MDREAKVRISVPAELAEEIVERMEAIAGTANCLAWGIESENVSSADCVAAARGLALQVRSLMLDMDVCSWSPGRHKVTEILRKTALARLEEPTDAAR